MSNTEFVNIYDYEKKAKEVLPKMVYDYYRSGATDENTLKWNEGDYSKIKLKPRVLRDVSKVSINTTLLHGRVQVETPILVAPTAMHSLANSNGEITTSNGVSISSKKTVMGISSWSTKSIESIVSGTSIADRNQFFLQLYLYKDRSLSLELVKRAEKLGFRAILLTVDTPVLGRREADIRNKFSLPNHLSLENYAESLPGESGDSGLASLVKRQIDSTLSWKDISWLKSKTSLPICLKGIQCAEDAVLAVKSGVDAILVSNHGARQLDTAVSTISLLPEIVKAVNSSSSSSSSSRKPEIWIDGGIRRGTDIIKALAIGAKAVFVGRPVLWGLSVNGSQGVAHVLNLLNNELEHSMRLMGISKLSELGPEAIILPNNQSFIHPRSKL